MATASRDSVVDIMASDEAPSPPPEETEVISQKSRGRKRLMRGLYRISSSSSLLKLKRKPSSIYRTNGRGSISCVSLGSPTSTSYGFNQNNAQGTQSSNQTPHTISMPATPGPDGPSRDHLSRVRFLNNQPSLLIPTTPATAPLPNELQSLPRPATSQGISPIQEDYFSLPVIEPKTNPLRPQFDFWRDMPAELKVQILSLLEPKEIIRCSGTSKYWHEMCFDGQLWAILDTAGFYRDIPADALVKIITHAGPFARDLNLRGCVQLWDQWRASNLADACRNLESISLEGCRVDRSSIHCLFYQNPRLLQVNLSGLPVVSNTTMHILAQQCPKLEQLNISWCNVDTKGLTKIVQSCSNLKDLRAGEVRGMNDIDFMQLVFERNTLERLILMSCETLTDEALSVLFEGMHPKTDFLTGHTIAPPRRLKYLDLSRCRNISDVSIRAMAQNVPNLEGLQLSKCSAITDSSLILLFPSLLRLTHLDLEELNHLTNASLQSLAKSPFRSSLQHLSISYCENLGDVGMIPVIKHCPSLRSLELDNTRISDLVLVEASEAVRSRSTISLGRQSIIKHKLSNQHDSSKPFVHPPKIGLRLIAYDCQNVTWTGIRAVMLKNAEIKRSTAAAFTQNALPPFPTPHLQAVNHSRTDESLQSALTRPSSPHPARPVESDVKALAPSMYPSQIIALKVFYGYQPTVTEHTRRVLAGNFISASRLERKWTEYMMASEEAGAPGGLGLMGGLVGGLGGLGGLNARRRRRRAREAAMMHADEEGVDVNGIGGTVGTGMGVGGVGRRRRARSGGGCTVM